MSDVVVVPNDPAKAFEQRVVEKLRADIGSLIPDEVLAGMVQKAVQDTFFAPTKAPNPKWSQYNYEPKTIDGPSWFQVEVAKAANPMVQAAVTAALAERHTQITEAIESELSHDKLLIIVARAVAVESGNVAANALALMVQELRNQGVLR